MQPRHPHRPVVRAVRRELGPPRPPAGRRRIGARLRALLLLAVIVGGGWYLWHQNRAPQAASEPVVAVRSGAVEQGLDVDALIVRREQVVTAPVAGQVRRLAAEGERVRVGAAVVEIGPASPDPAGGGSAAGGSSPAQPREGQPVAAPGATAARREYDRLNGEIYRLVVEMNTAKYAGEAEKASTLEAEINQLVLRQVALLGQLDQGTPPAPAPAPAPAPPLQNPRPDSTRVTSQVAGILLYQTDGLEGVLAPGESERWTPSWVRGLPYPDLKQTRQETVAAGQPLFKVVDDLDLELVVVVPASRFTPSQRTIMAEEGLAVRLAGKERPLTARLIRMAEEGEELLLHLTIPLPTSETLRVRRMRVRLLLETFEGIVVPRSAIDVQDGQTGLWVRSGSGYQFTQVRVIGGNPDEVVVEGELAPDAVVLRQPPPPAR
ncbi:MAG: HlyD family efflux transporter periplasmic adaptor subunit [Bacillota bacterium]